MSFAIFYEQLEINHQLNEKEKEKQIFLKYFQFFLTLLDILILPTVIFLRASSWISMSSTTSQNNFIEYHEKPLTSSLRLLTSRTAEVCAFVGTRTPRPAAPRGNPPKPANPPVGGTPLYGPAKGEGRPCMAAKGVGSTPGAPAMDSTSGNLQAIVSTVSLIGICGDGPMVGVLAEESTCCWGNSRSRETESSGPIHGLTKLFQYLWILFMNKFDSRRYKTRLSRFGTSIEIDVDTTIF